MKVKEKIVGIKNKIKEKEETPEMQKALKQSHNTVLLAIIVVLLLILIILCFRVGKIGYNYLSIWGVKPTTVVVKNENLQITTNTGINLFGNSLFEGKNIIAPMSKGSANFTIRNDTNEDIVYHFRFVDEMNNFVNMKYRLKIDNIYIRGNEQEYISIKDLDVENVILPKDSTSIYTLDWFWESDDEKDTFVGTQDEKQHYTLNLYIFSQAYQKGGNNN